MSRDSHRPSKKKGPSKLAHPLTAISTLNPGLTMVVGQYSALSMRAANPC